jgi:zona occludens toxin (predicted ATPase)
MIYGVFGLPGSGKTYVVISEFVVNRIQEGETVVSNIKLSDDYEVPENYIYLEKEDLNNLHRNIETIMLNEETSHDDKKERLNFLFSLYGKGDITLIVDECHLYGYRGRSSQIAWADDFLSIHRHALGDERKFDILLITQVPSRLNTEIANQVEVAINAIPASQRVMKSMLEYQHYGSVDALKKRDKLMRLKTQIVKGKKEIFDLYQSGYSNEGAGDFRKKMYLMVVGLVLVIAFVITRFMDLSAVPSEGGTRLQQHMTKASSINDNNGTINKVMAEVKQRDYIISCITSDKPSKDMKEHKDFMYEIAGEKKYQYCFKRYLS